MNWPGENEENNNLIEFYKAKILEFLGEAACVVNFCEYDTTDVCQICHLKPLTGVAAPVQRTKWVFDFYQQPTAVCFVDFAAASDSVHRESLWRMMALDGVSPKLIAMIKVPYRSTSARVRVHNNLSQPFGIRALHEDDGVEFATGHRLTDFDYVDGIARLAPSFGDQQPMVSRVNDVAKSVGWSINAEKTKVFSSGIPDQEKAPLEIDGCQLVEVNSFKYLGARLLPNGQSKDGIVSRIDAA
ncbi:hypothetical protein SprV_0301236700 [Sparganum proliferum]